MLIRKIPAVLVALSMLGALVACEKDTPPRDKSAQAADTVTVAKGESTASAQEDEPAAGSGPAGSTETEESPVVEEGAADPAVAGPPGTPGPTDTSTVKGPKQHIVLAGATSFSPIILFTNPGDEVCWENMTAHDSQSMEGLIPETAETWHVELGRNGCVTLPVEGAYLYKCNPHYPVGMAGAIVVGKASNMAQIEANVTGRAKGVVIKLKRAIEAQAQ